MQKKNMVRVSKNKWLDLLVFILFLNVFFFHSFGALALVLFLMGSYLLLVRAFGGYQIQSMALFVVSISTMLFVSSPEKVILLTLFAIAIMLTSVYQGLKGGPIGGILELGLSSLIVIREYLRSGFAIIGGVMSGSMREVIQLESSSKERSPWVKSIFVGLLAGLPLVAWLVMTLSKADPVFAAFVKGLISEKFLTDLPARFALSILSLFFLLPVVVMKWRGYTSPVSWISRVRFGREMSVILVMVVVVMGIFLAVQWPYVFASVAKETDLSKYGVATYSEYVQKGFWDLLKVAAMVFGTSWIALLFSKNQKGNEQKVLLTIQAILASEFTIFIISIFRRVYLYQSYHGLTLARLYGLVLLIGIVGMMVTMGLRYFYQNIRWVKAEMAWIVIVIFGSILINMESLIVKDPPTVNGRIDYVYLSRLPGDGYEGWQLAYKNTASRLDELANAKLVGIGIEPRREVFYGGLVIGSLIQNYDKLIWQYGSDDEIKVYMLQILDWEEKMLIKYPEILTSQLTGGKEQAAGLIKDTRDMIAGESWAKAPVVIRDRSQYFGRTYTFSGYDAGFYGLVQGGLEESKRLAKFDNFLKYNRRDQLIYKQMRQDIPVEGMLGVVEDYWTLRLQIITQPETERTVEADLSFESPFLR